MPPIGKKKNLSYAPLGKKGLMPSWAKNKRNSLMPSLAKKICLKPLLSKKKLAYALFGQRDCLMPSLAQNEKKLSYALLCICLLEGRV